MEGCLVEPAQRAGPRVHPPGVKRSSAQENGPAKDNHQAVRDLVEDEQGRRDRRPGRPEAGSHGRRLVHQRGFLQRGGFDATCQHDLRAVDDRVHDRNREERDEAPATEGERKADGISHLAKRQCSRRWRSGRCQMADAPSRRDQF